MYHGWFDDNPKTSDTQKMLDAIAAYMRRFGTQPNIILVNESQLCELLGYTVRAENFIRKNNFWVGCEPSLEAQSEKSFQ